jgi:hypothetical protein
MMAAIKKAKRIELLQSRLQVDRYIAAFANEVKERIVGVRTVEDSVLYAIDYLWLCDKHTADRPEKYNAPRLPDMLNGIDIDGSPYKYFHPMERGVLRRIRATNKEVVVGLGMKRSWYVYELAAKFRMEHRSVILSAIAIVNHAIAAQQSRSPVVLVRTIEGALKPFVPRTRRAASTAAA